MKMQLSAAAAATALVLGTGVANAQSGNGTASLAGNVSGHCDLSIYSGTNSGASINANPVIDGGSTSFTLNISCNDIEGATLQVDSSSNGFLHDDSPTLVGYDVDVTGFPSGASMSFHSGTIGSISEPGSLELADLDGVDLTAELTHDGGDAYGDFAGGYTDSLVFNISANL